MKKISLITLFVLLFSISNALADQRHIYANFFTTNNISFIQHSILTNSAQIFEGTAMAALGERAKLVKHEKSTPQNLYGDSLMYGQPLLYGEYRDEGDEDNKNTKGRNGGDDKDAEYDKYSRPEVNNLWLTWQHFGDDVKFEGIDDLDTDTDLIMFGLTGSDHQHKKGISKWGVFGGFVGGNQQNDFIDINENGGYFGIYTGYNVHNFNLSFIADAGALYNNAENIYGNDEFTNAWAGAALNATYNIELDKTFTLQPGIYTGYTWIGSANYISSSDDVISNKNINLFEITPEFRAIKCIGNGWFASLNFKYAFVMGQNDGNIIVNGIQVDDLNSQDYAEYGLGIEKSIDRFNVALNLNRRDGGRTGWSGGFNMKYIF